MAAFMGPFKDFNDYYLLLFTSSACPSKLKNKETTFYGNFNQFAWVMILKKKKVNRDIFYAKKLSGEIGPSPCLKRKI